MKRQDLPDSQTAYKTLCDLSKRATLLDGIGQLLGWDQETYMPEKAAPVRASQLELIAELSHSVKTGKPFETALKALTKSKSLKEPEKSVVRLLERDFNRESKLPKQFVQEFARTTSKGQVVWQKAKKQKKFSLFKPHLEHIVALVRKKADYFGYTDHPYDALVDEYEPGMTTKALDTLFSELKKTSTAIVTAWQDRKEKPLHIKASDSEQIALCKWLLECIGFDFSRGRVDLSAHPFSSSCHPNDSRMTTRLESHGIVTQVLTTLHEAGHSFYEMGLQQKYYGLPLCQSVSLGIHESQSRFWETRIGRSRAFWKMLYPELKKKFPSSLKSLTLDTLMQRLNQVSPSFIRVDADEVTYPLHVILRFEIEKELVQGSLKVKDVPERWNAAMKSLLGITPKDDAEGCLQDIHWSMGAIGYFPTYSLGNIYAASIFDVFQKAHTDWEKTIARKEFGFIHDFLYKYVWQHGRRYDGSELIKKITGKPLSCKPYITYLNEKYA